MQLQFPLSCWSLLEEASSLALILTGEMYSEKYKEMGLSTLNLSRTMEDFGTGLAGFIPWSGSGVYYPSVLGVPIIQYLPYCFMSYAVWVLAYVYAATGICIKPLEKETAEETPLEEAK